MTAPMTMGYEPSFSAIVRDEESLLARARDTFRRAYGGRTDA